MTTKTNATTEAARAKDATRAAAAHAERSVRAIVRDSAYATIGAGDSAARYVRGLGAAAAALRAEATSVGTLTRPGELSKAVRALRSSAVDEFDALANRGRKVVEGIQRNRTTQRAFEQTRRARRQAGAATTSLRRAADETVQAAGEAGSTVASAGPIDYESMTVEELREIARDRGVEGRSELRKDELVKVLRQS